MSGDVTIAERDSASSPLGITRRAQFFKHYLKGI